MFTQARSLDIAQKSSATYQTQYGVSATQHNNCSQQNFTLYSAQSRQTSATQDSAQSRPYQASPTTSTSTKTCPYCGYQAHPRFNCPASNATCRKCNKRGHFQSVCRAKPQQAAAASQEFNFGHTGVPEFQEAGSNLEAPSSNSRGFIPWLAATGAATNPSNKSLIQAKLGKSEKIYTALPDSGSDPTFIHPRVVQSSSFRVYPTSKEIAMASTTLSTKVMGCCREDITVEGNLYKDVELLILPGLCTDIIIGRDFLSRHQSVTLKYGGDQPPLILGALGKVNIDPPALFPYMHTEVIPLKDRSRKYSKEDREFIEEETQKMLEDGIIEKSTSPWRAQCVVVKHEGQKKRLAIDYSATINQYTHLDAYPVPNIDGTVNDIAQYNIFSTVDLRRAYHQFEIREEDKPYTAFEGNGVLYQFCRLPFGVTNGVAIFQREMDKLIKDNALDATFAYLDNITICGKDQAHHDENLRRFMEVAEKMNLTYNESKCEFSTTRLKILGSIVEGGTIKPDPDRLKPLMELSPPKNVKELRRVMGFFAHYSKYITSFSAKLRPLSQTKSFPISEEAVTAFNVLKSDIQNSVIGAVDTSLPFTLETDASDFAIAAVLNQSGRPVAFFSRTLQPSEIKHSSVEKEAQAIIESVRYWRHFLTGAHFTLRTDQRSVSYMFDKKHQGKIKNDKIYRWRMELSCYSFDIEHTPGVQNIPADTFSRSTCSGTVNTNKLYHVHDSLCHPGVTRLFHFVKTKNLTYTLEEVREMIKACQTCAENKPHFYRPEASHLIKATQPFERLSCDFKGPLPSTNKNIYLLDIIDEYSRFPFSFPCPDMTAATLIKCFTQLFSMFGMPGYIHSDQGASLMSKAFKDFLFANNVASSRTTPYNPACNGQVEKTNGTLWKAITLRLKSLGLPQSHWQEVLPDALHSVRSLLCTATNATPHERFCMFQRRSASGTSIPSWLSEGETALLKRNVRRKQDALVEQVEVLHANPQYVHVRMPTGKEKTVSIRQLAPSGTVSEIQPDSTGNENTSDPPQQPDILMPQPEPVLNPLLVEPEVPATPVSDKPKRAPLLLKQLQAHNAPGFKEEHLQPIQEGRVTRSRYK